jgi:glycine cleavage system T protein (aminomethyltransferase)
MRQTPLYGEFQRAGAKVVDFHGWALPVQFTGIVQEHAHTRQKASLFDCSHMGEFSITGEESIQAYDTLVCSDVMGLRVGRARYGAILNEAGGIIDDTIALKLAPDELYVVTNAGPLDEVARLIAARVPDVEDVSDATAKIDVQGPLARDVLSEVGLTVAGKLRYFGGSRAEWRGQHLIVSRTGYTGELGFELFLPADAAVELWRALEAVDGVAPAGLGARDTLRTEMGYPLSGQDVDASRTPLEAAMEPFIAWDTDFVGRDALRAQQERGAYQVLTAIRTMSRRAPRPGFALSHEGAAAGTVTSGTFGPSVGHGIGLAYLSREHSAPGTRLTMGAKGIDVETVVLPFYAKGTCRAE